jgi:TolA-binding protein
MHKNVFSDGEVAEFQNKNFVSIETNVDRAPESVDTWRIKLVPATFVVTPDRVILHKLGDEYNPKSYRETLRRAMARAEELRKLQKEAADAPDDPEPCLKIVRFCSAPENRAPAAEWEIEAARRFAARKTDADREQALAQLQSGADALTTAGASPEVFGRIASLFDDLSRPDLALFFRGIAEHFKNNPDGLYEKMTELRNRHPDSDRDDAALVWMGYVLLQVRKDRPAARRVYQEFVEKYPKSPYFSQVEPIHRELKDEQ